VGLDDVYLQPDLDRLILRIVGLDDGTDETSEFYFEIMERRSREIESDNDSIMTQALKAYMELTFERKRRKMLFENKNRMSLSGPGRCSFLRSGPFSMKVDMSLKDHLKEFSKDCLLFQSPEAINWLYGAAAWSSFGLLIHALTRLMQSFGNP
jgi:hypothetical protein